MRSFDADPAGVGTGPLGQRAHRRHLEHSVRLERRLYAVRPGVWTLVGNGLSNQTFLEGPEGLIAIDTGESVEEMRTALAEVRARFRGMRSWPRMGRSRGPAGSWAASSTAALVPPT